MQKRKLILLSIIAVLSFVLLVEASFTLRWRLPWDPAIVCYAGYLMHEFHYVPYRDFFEQNMPGTFFINAILVALTGCRDLAFRIADVSLLAVVLANTFFILRKINALFALFVSLVCGFGFFFYGQAVSLQKEFFILVFLTTSLTAYSYIANTVIRSAMVSLLLGMCVTIKPHSVVVFPVFLFLLIREECNKGRSLKSLASAVSVSLAAFSAPLALMLFYLWTHGALPSFLDLATNYWPLFAHIDKHLVYRVGWDRTAFVIKEFLKFGDHSLLLLPAFVGFKFAGNGKCRGTYLLFAGGAAVFSAYPALSGQFHDYHLFPFLYFTLIAASFSVIHLFTDCKLGKKSLTIRWLLMVSLLFYLIPQSVLRTINLPVGNPRTERTDKFVEYLRGEHVTKQTRVQPLDYVGGGAVYAMFITGVRPGTRFLLDFFFYHSVSTPYIRQLRRQFLAELYAHKPDYVIQITSEDKLWISGHDTSREFAELKEFLAKYYFADVTSNDYTIYKLNPL
jgi:hypothetical protein